MKGVLLLISLVANAVLVFFLLRQVREEPPVLAAVPLPTITGTPQIARTTNTDSQLKELQATLSACKLDPQMATRLVVLDAIDRMQSREPDAFWVPETARSIRSQREQADSAAEVRAQLLATVGAEVATNPAARPLFQPLWKQFPFLSADKQLLVQSLILREQEAALDRNKRGFSPSDPRVSTNPSQRVLAAAAEFLTPAELGEMKLRLSSVAQSLLRTGFDFTEREFRAAHAALYKRPANPQGLRMTADTENTELREALGEQRYAQFRRLNDPEYFVIAAAGGQAGLPPEKIDAAYSEVVSAREFIERAKQRDKDIGAEIRRIEVARDNKLREILGPVAYGAVTQRRQFANAREQLRPAGRSPLASSNGFAPSNER